jgi:hypothetical protein
MNDLTLQRGLAIAITLALLLFVFELVRRKQLSERYAILWLLAAMTLFVLAAWKGLLTTLSNDVGISYPPSALFAVAIGLIVVLLMYFSLVVSRLSDQNKILAQRLALLQRRVEESEERSARAASETFAQDAGAAAVSDPDPRSVRAPKELSSSR